VSAVLVLVVVVVVQGWAGSAVEILFELRTAYFSHCRTFHY
jgi:hypothetical protein